MLLHYLWNIKIHIYDKLRCSCLMKRNLVIQFGRQCYCQVYNSCSKCPLFARTNAPRRRLRHSSIASSMTLWPITMSNVQQTILQFVKAVQLRLMHSLLDVTGYLVIDLIKVDTSLFGDHRSGGMKAGIDCLKIAQCRVPDRPIQVRCLVERFKKLPDTSWITGNSCCDRSMSR